MEDTFTAGIAYAHGVLIAYAEILERETRSPALAYRYAADMVRTKGAAEARRIARGAPVASSAPIADAPKDDPPILAYLARVPTLQAAE